MAEARRLHKTLVTFSHYPLVDFNDGVSDYVKKIWGNRRFDLDRVPEAEVSEAFWKQVSACILPDTCT